MRLEVDTRAREDQVGLVSVGWQIDALRDKVSTQSLELGLLLVDEVLEDLGLAVAALVDPASAGQADAATPVLDLDRPEAPQ